MTSSIDAGIFVVHRVTPMRHLAALVFILFALPAVAAERQALTVDGFERAYYLASAVPAGAKAAVVLVLHGGGGNGPDAMTAYRWAEKAAQEGFVAVAPEALPADPARPANFRTNPRFWRDGSSGRGGLAAPVDDVAYVAAVLDDLAARFRIDESRVYATGFSSGATMVWRLAASLGERFAAMAPVAGYPSNILTVTPKSSPGLFYITGAQDPLNPLDGGPIQTPWGVNFKPPSAEVPAHWASAMGCAAPVEVGAGADLHERRWPGCTGGRSLHYLVIDGLGHHWAGGVKSALPERWVGAWLATPDTTALIWDFFRERRLP